MLRILIAEDDPDIQELLQAYLSEEGYDTIPAMDGEQALERFHGGRIDLVLLDLMMPRLDGYGVCRAIRAESDVPIIMLTALDSEAHQLKGFDLRIDDYVTKPFSMPVLLRKVEAVLRRTTGQSGGRQIVYRDLLLDLDGYTAYVGGAKIELTRREFELLKSLLQNQGRVLSRQTLLNRVWSYDFYGDERIVDTHVKNLRKKLGGDYIETIRGVGYRIDREHKA
ncbi:MAG: response regulator transcription factor [Oscillospiraceae bacterium]|nr:response regulator transcription factor [Oscillospiraceae bacterium]